MTMKWYWTSRSQGGGGRWWRWQTGETPTNKVQKDKTCEVDFFLHFTSIYSLSNEPVFKQSIIVNVISAMGEAQIETGCLMSLSTSGKGLASVQSLVQVFNFTAYYASRRLLCQIRLHCKKIATKSLNKCSLILFVHMTRWTNVSRSIIQIFNINVMSGFWTELFNHVISSNQKGLFKRG